MSGPQLPAGPDYWTDEPRPGIRTSGAQLFVCDSRGMWQSLGPAVVDDRAWRGAYLQAVARTIEHERWIKA